MDINQLSNIVQSQVQMNNSYYELLFPNLYYSDEQYSNKSHLGKNHQNTKHKLNKFVKINTKANKIIQKQRCYDVSNKIEYMKYIFTKNFVKDRPKTFFKNLWTAIDKVPSYLVKSHTKQFYAKLLNDFDKLNLFKKYSYRVRKIKKTILRSSLKEETFNESIVQLLSDYLELNIIIISNSKEINFYCQNFKFNIYRQTIILEKNGDKYQLIHSMDKKIFTSSDKIVSQLCKYICMKQIEHLYENKQQTFESKSTKKIVEIIKPQYTQASLKKMKLGELQDIAKTLDIITQIPKKSCGMKNKTKTVLISDIMK